MTCKANCDRAIVHLFCLYCSMPKLFISSEYLKTVPGWLRSISTKAAFVGQMMTVFFLPSIVLARWHPFARPEWLWRDWDLTVVGRSLLSADA
ncbi:MAG: hypothetical protein IGR76_14345 [Synechococcales cyanobacterium T60_A2020_003]|nr:hypothetical protein [Synechococcales cyanobacterium T60_A2020_003]